MTDQREQMSAETRELLGELTKDDIALLKKGLPIIRALYGFSTVMKWLAIAAIGTFGGVVLLGESIQKIWGWLVPPPHP